MNFLLKLPKARGSWRILFLLLLLLLSVLFFFWFIAPSELRNYLNKRGGQLPDYRFHTREVEIHLWNCSLDLVDVQLVKKSGDIPVPFFICPRVRIAMQWREILHANLRSSISLIQPVVNFVQGPSEEQSQTYLEPAWVTEVKQLVPLQINRFTVTQGDIHFYDFHADPRIDLEMDQVELRLDNLTNSNHTHSLMPSTAVLTGRPFKVGKFDAHLALNVDMKQPTFAEKIQLEDIPAPALNAFLAKYGSVYAKSGDLAFYTEMVSAKGDFQGYVKPFFQNLEFEPMPKDRNGLAAIWAGLVNGVKDVLENNDNAVATKIPVSGHYSDPNVDFLSAAFGLIKNAYLQALAQGFDKPELAPAPEKQEISQTAIKQAAGSN
jgi:hypothetical protein